MGRAKRTAGWGGEGYSANAVNGWLGKLPPGRCMCGHQVDENSSRSHRSFEGNPPQPTRGRDAGAHQTEHTQVFTGRSVPTVDGQRLCPLNSSPKMSSRAARCSVDDAAPWRPGGRRRGGGADGHAGDAQHAGGGAHGQSLELCLADRLPARLLAGCGWAQRPSPGLRRGAVDGGPVREFAAARPSGLGRAGRRALECRARAARPSGLGRAGRG